MREHHADFLTRAARLTTEVSQLPLAAVLEALRLAREAGLSTVVDLDVPPSDAVPTLGDAAQLEAVLAAADLLKPAKGAARELVPEARDAVEMAAALRARFDATVVITDGEAGCAVAAPGFEGRVAGYDAKEVVDTTGAGDAFLGGLLAALQGGLGFPEAAALANACGAACVERLGAFPDDPAAARTRALELYDGPSLELGPPPAAGVAGRAAEEALRTFETGVEELSALRNRLDAESFERATALIRAAVAEGGRVHVTGVGKPEHVAHYAAIALSSTGTPATFLHATEAVHGSAGQVVAGDVVIAISNSGETAELRHAVEAVQALGARVVAVTGDRASWLGTHAEVVLDAGVAREGGGLGLAPRASVAAELLVLAALSAALETASGLTRADYHARHPAGALGEKSREG